jgi:hypothetical protein
MGRRAPVWVLGPDKLLEPVIVRLGITDRVDTQIEEGKLKEGNEVIGVLKPKGQSGMGQDQDDTIIAPYTTVQKKILGITAGISIGIGRGLRPILSSTKQPDPERPWQFRFRHPGPFALNHRWF